MLPCTLLGHSHLSEAEGALTRTSLNSRFYSDGQHRLSRCARSTRPRKYFADLGLQLSWLERTPDKGEVVSSILTRPTKLLRVSECERRNRASYSRGRSSLLRSP